MVSKCRYRLRPFSRDGGYGNCAVAAECEGYCGSGFLFSARFVQEKRCSAHDGEKGSDKADFATRVEYPMKPFDNLMHGHSLVGKSVHARAGLKKIIEIK